MNGINEKNVIDYGTQKLVLDENDGKYKTLMGFVPDSKEEYAYKNRVEKIQVHHEAVELHGFDLEMMMTYPYNCQPKDIPVHLLKDP